MTAEISPATYLCLTDGCRFPLRVLSECSGVNRATIGNWLLVGGWEFPTKGVGKDRKYGAWDLVMCVIVRELVALGVSSDRPARAGMCLASAAFDFVRQSIEAGKEYEVPPIALIKPARGKVIAVPAGEAAHEAPAIILPIERSLRFALDGLELTLYPPLRQIMPKRKIAF